jgi:diguanylate cyclase (GGDEF)-like protein
MFSIDKSVRQHVRLWKSVFIAGSFLGGICWGLPGFLLFPGATVTQQELMILMLAGISAGAVPLSAALPEAAITFLITSITPYLITIYTLHQSIFVLFLFALTLYLIFMISLSLGTYKMIKNSMILKYEKDVLLHKIKKSNKMLQKSATHDPLTKIANRILFEESLNKLITTSSALHTEFALMFIDLDQFKLINDIYGHEIGDIILINTTEKIKQCIHPDDIIARLGGDEIAVIVKKLVESEYLEKVATCICNVINQPVEIKNHTIHISASIGISKFPHDGVDREELLRVADKRMYRSKSFGGNRVTFSDSTKEDLVDHS